MLTGVLKDEDLLKHIVVCYFDPATKENAAVRQALSYFLPVYCHSRRENMESMALVAQAVIHAVIGFVEELDEEEEMVGIGVVGNMLVDWTDARKLVVQEEGSVTWDEAGRKEVKAVNGDIHLGMAENLLEKAMGHGCTSKFHAIGFQTHPLTLCEGEEKKAVLPLLGKLYISANSTQEKLQTARELVAEAIDMKIANDAASRTGLSKLHAALTKVIGEAGKPKRTLEEETVVDVGSGGEPGARDSPAKADAANVKMDDAVDDAGTGASESNVRTAEVQNSLLEELLEDDDEEL